MKQLFIFAFLLSVAGCDLEELGLEIDNTVGNEIEINSSLTDNDEENRATGKVVNIVDGDTFDIEIEGIGLERVRPILVNAPEICNSYSSNDCEPEPYGEKATDFTEDLLLNQIVYLEQDVSERDQYDRMLFYVYLENGDMFQELILEEGLAQIAIYEPDTRYETEFKVIEDLAKKSEVGIWE